MTLRTTARRTGLKSLATGALLAAGLLIGLAPNQPQGRSGTARAQEKPAAGPNADLDAVLVTVNGRPITGRDLELRFLSRRVKPERQAALRDQHLEDLVSLTLLQQFLDSKKIRASQKLVDERVGRMQSLLEREGHDFDQVLKSLGCTRESFAAQIALPLAWDSYVRPELTDDVIRQYWIAHKPELDGTEVRASQIVRRLPPPEATEGMRNALKQELQQLRAKIIGGELTFADAAKKHSEAPSARDGGDMGRFPYRGRMLLDFTRVAFALKPGEVSDVFETRFGLHLLTVTETQPGDLSLEDVREPIATLISDQMQSDLIAKLRHEAKIERPR